MPVCGFNLTKWEKVLRLYFCKVPSKRTRKLAILIKPGALKDSVVNFSPSINESMNRKCYSAENNRWCWANGHLPDRSVYKENHWRHLNWCPWMNNDLALKVDGLTLQKVVLKLFLDAHCSEAFYFSTWTFEIKFLSNLSDDSSNLILCLKQIFCSNNQCELLLKMLYNFNTLLENVDLTVRQTI